MPEERRGAGAALLTGLGTTREGGLPRREQLVLAAAVVLVGAQLGLRAWALYGSWFYTDDYRLLKDAPSSGGTSGAWHYLNSPFDSQYMPLGRAIVWLVASGGHVDWTLAASLTLALQLIASAACWWMLTTLFGPRPAVLVPLALYLSLATTVPALMWWAASLNQLPLQAVIFAAVAAWVRYLRTGDRRWLALTGAVAAAGLLCYIKALLVPPLLLWLALAYFSAGGARRRLGAAMAGRRASVTALVVGAGAAAVAYHLWVPSVFKPPSWHLAADLAGTMVGTTLPTSLLGGPWAWNDNNPPVALAAPPDWTVPPTWVTLVLIGLYLALRRRNTGRAWVLLAGWVTADFMLLLYSRAPLLGSFIGHEPRYLTDVVPIAVLCLGLATMPLLGAVEASEPREVPLLGIEVRPRIAVALAVAVCLSGVVSTVRYVGYWHHDNAGDSWAHAVMDGLRGQGPVDLVDAVVPRSVVPAFSYPANTTRALVPLLADNVSFPTVTDDLVALDDSGTPHHATIDSKATSLPGTVDGCGYLVTSGADVTIPLDATTVDYTWWVRISYLGSAEGQVRVQAGSTTTEAPVRRGLASIYLQVTSSVGSVTLGGLADGTDMCVDAVQVGQAAAGGNAL